MPKWVLCSSRSKDNMVGVSVSLPFVMVVGGFGRLIE